jgi:hypothetical protein
LDKSFQNTRAGWYIDSFDLSYMKRLFFSDFAGPYGTTGPDGGTDMEPRRVSGSGAGRGQKTLGQLPDRY